MIGRRTGREDAQLVHELFPCGNRQVSLGGGGCEPPSPDKYCLPWNYVCHVCPFARFISHRPSSFTFRPSFNWSWLTATERVKTQMLLQCSFVLRSSAPFDPGRIGSGEEERTEFPGSIIPRPWRKRVPLNGGSSYTTGKSFHWRGEVIGCRLSNEHGSDAPAALWEFDTTTRRQLK